MTNVVYLVWDHNFNLLGVMDTEQKARDMIEKRYGELLWDGYWADTGGYDTAWQAIDPRRVG